MYLFQLCLVSLSMFHTLVNLNCEDVMFELVFKYVILFPFDLSHFIYIN